MREYAAIATGTVATMISSDILWNTTSKPIEGVVFMALLIGLLVAIGFIALTEMFEGQKKVPVKKKRSRSQFVTLENGLSVLVQRSSKRRSA